MNDKSINARLAHPSIPVSHDEFSALSHALHRIFKDEYAIDLKASKILHALGKGLGFENAHHMKKVLESFMDDAVNAISAIDKIEKENAEQLRKLKIRSEAYESTRKAQEELGNFMECGHRILSQPKQFAHLVFHKLGLMTKNGLSKEKSRALLLRFNDGDLDTLSFVHSHGYDHLNSNGVKEFVDSAYLAEYLSIVNRINPDYFFPHLPHTADKEMVAHYLHNEFLTLAQQDYLLFIEQFSPTDQAKIINEQPSKTLDSFIKTAVTKKLSVFTDSFLAYCKENSPTQV